MKSRTLRGTILFTFIAVCFIGSISLFFIAVRYSRLAVRAIIHDNVSIIADRIDDTIGEVINEKFNFLEYTSNLAVLQDPKQTLFQKQAIVGPFAKDKSKDLITLTFIDADGNAYLGQNMIMNFNSAPIVQTVTKTKKTTMVGPTADNISKELSINIGCPVFHNGNEYQGMLLARLDCKFLCEIASRIKIGSSGYAIFIDRATGNTIGASDVELVKQGQNLSQIAKDSGNGDLSVIMDKIISGESNAEYCMYEGAKKTFVYRPISNTNWSVLIIGNDKDFFFELKFMELLLFFSTVLLLVISAVAAIVIVRNLSPLNKVAEAITEISSGNADLTQRLTIKHGKREIVGIVNGFNAFVSKMQEIITSMKMSETKLLNAESSLKGETQETSAAINQILENITNVNQQIVNQTNSVDETAGAVNEIASNIESLEKMIQNQAEGVTQASCAVEQMVGNINSVNHSVDIMFNSFKELEQNTTNGIKTQTDVNEIIKQVEEESISLQDANSAIAAIAEQTNLLAMNAAIEAAHAGEAGKGFSVVADEIRKLSETSTEQSKKIGDELKKIQESINSVVTASENATTAFKSVSESITNTDQLVRQIKGAMEEQQVGSKQITDALHSMNDSTIEVRSASAEMAEGNKQILSEITKLQEVTANMKQSISDMSEGAQRISDTGTALSNVSGEVSTSIESIKDEIDQFKV